METFAGERICVRCQRRALIMRQAINKRPARSTRSGSIRCSQRVCTVVCIIIVAVVVAAARRTWLKSGRGATCGNYLSRLAALGFRLMILVKTRCGRRNSRKDQTKSAPIAGCALIETSASESLKKPKA